MDINTVKAMENDCRRRHYAIKVDVSANGDTSVTLKNPQTYNTFDGFSNQLGGFAYPRALEQAYNHMLAYENRHGK